MRTLSLVLSLILGVFALAACGGGGGGGGAGGGAGGGGAGAPAGPVTLELVSNAPRDGRVRSDGLVNAGDLLRVGDDDLERGWRGFLSFTLPVLGPGQRITEARLVAQQLQVQGTPYADLGDILIDLVDLGDALDATDYGAGALLAILGGGAFSDDGTAGERELDAMEALRIVERNGGSRVEFRLRYGPRSDGDGAHDVAIWRDADTAAASGVAPPKLIVTIE